VFVFKNIHKRRTSTARARRTRLDVLPRSFPLPFDDIPPGPLPRCFLDTRQTLLSLGISLGLGLLVGLQRERKGEELAGIRTFALLSVLGTILGLLGRAMGSNGSWVVPAGALAVGLVLAVGAFNKARINQVEIGLTTEIAALVVYALGAYIAYLDGDRLVVAIVLGGVIVLLLYWKDILHGFVKHLGDKDVAAIMTFVLIALVIWPVLPQDNYGPYNFFNPFQTWLVVVLVVGMSLAGYVLYKLVPPTASAILGGAVGGLISSTATTVSYARRSHNSASDSTLAAQAIMTANTISVLRVIALLALFTQSQIVPMLAPLAAMAGVMAALALLTFWMGRHEKAEMPPQGNPTELKGALLFAAIYTLVKLATAWGKATFGSGAAKALFVIGGISGLTDVDAITLSMSESARNGSVALDVVWRVVLVAVLANMLFKGGCVMVLGNARLKKWVGVLFGLAIAGGVVILVGWR
jgi:uncharacterized membrane protein (DUF4010 family)